MFVAVVDIGGIEGFQHPLALEVNWWIMIPVELVGVSVNQQCFGCITGRHDARSPLFYGRSLFYSPTSQKEATRETKSPVFC